MQAANQVTIEKLKKEGQNEKALAKYAVVGKLFSNQQSKSDAFYADFLLEKIEAMAAEMRIPKLYQCGVGSSDHTKIAAVTDNKFNPVALSRDEILQVLELAR
jgi:hypothetical protein